jgi:hypothetical protein
MPFVRVPMMAAIVTLSERCTPNPADCWHRIDESVL